MYTVMHYKMGVIGVFSPLNFKNYLLSEFRSYRKSNELRSKPNNHKFRDIYKLCIAVHIIVSIPVSIVYNEDKRLFLILLQNGKKCINTAWVKHN